MSSLNQVRRLKKESLEDDHHFQDEMDQLLDLSNIKNISSMRNDNDEINPDQIEVDLDEDELAEMERIMRTKMNFANGDSESNSPPVGSGQLNIQDVQVDTPPSQFEADQETEEDKKRLKMEQQKLFQQNQHQQIQRELRELLAQSSSEQLLLINDENEKIGETEHKQSSPPLVSSNKNTPLSEGMNPGRQAVSTTPVDIKSPVLMPEPVSNISSKKFESDAGDLIKHQKKKSNSIDKPVPSNEKEKAEAPDDNDSFHRLYNKEIKVNQDEIPLLLLELTDIAYKFIKKDQFEKAYVLLQKTESVLEVVNLEHSKRDRYFAYITYHNMAMCFQKLGMLEECIIYLKETISVIDKSNFFKDVSISQRMKQMHMQCQLKLQLCAILSQTQKHTEAMENAKISVRLGHQILRDMYDLCVFYSNKIKFKDDFASLSLFLNDDEKEGNETKDGKTKSQINEKLMHKQFIRDNSPVRDIPYNILEESISMIERTALKLLPIMKELGNRLAGINGQRGQQAFHIASQTKDPQIKNLQAQKDQLKNELLNKKNGHPLSDDEDNERDIKDAEFNIGSKPQATTSVEKKDTDQIDMRTVLGFLNQNEWILNLNIGNIMQIQPVRMKDFMQSYRNEHQLSRESFLEKLQLLIVSYFCVSTEMRFIVQSRSGFMKPDVKKEKELEQEYWHVKALEIACAFLPSECPLFNHILLSYQKHHDPTMQPIKEDEEQEDVISVLRPLKGIENSKYQPMIRELNNVYIDIAEIPVSPLSKCFDQRLLPKKVKTTSMNIQTEEQIEKKPVMKTQSISVQDDLKVEKKVSAVESQTSNGDFDANNAYMDFSSSKYEEQLLSKIIDDPNISDKHQFLGKLIGRVQSQDPDKFMKSSSVQHNPGFTYANTLSQNLNIVHSHMVSFQQPNNVDTKTTLSLDPRDDAPYGGKKLVNKGSKQTQSGQINYRSRPSRGTTKNKNTNFEHLDFSSFDHKDQKSQIFNNHIVSLYGDVISNDATTINQGAKHHIASQSLAPSQSVLTDQQRRANKINHKKSMSGGNSVDIFPNKKDRNLNHSVNSISSTKYGTKKKSTLVQDNIKISNNKLLSGLKNNSNINLSNQKNQQSKKPTKYLQNAHRYDEKTVTKDKKQKKMTNIQTAPALASGGDILMKEINDVMSQSSQEDSNPDPDLHPLPDSSCSEAGKKSPIQILQAKEDDSIMISDNNQPKVILKRPSSAITNYTSGTLGGANSGIKGRQSKQRLQNVQSHNRGLKQTKVQQQQNIVTQVKQAKQRAQYSGAPLVPKKKTKVLSRKKYGSDRSSDSPMREQSHYTTQDQVLPPDYSIAQQPGYSIFDSGNTHSNSKVSQHQNSKQSISNFTNENGLRKKSKGLHSNSQTLQIDKKLKNTTKTLKTDVNNQSENILAKLQNLLQNREEEKLEMAKKAEKRSQGLNSQAILLRNPRGGYANSNGSLKSRVSRSKSSGNGRSKEPIAPNNNSVIFQSHNSQQEQNNSSHDKKVARSSALQRSRPKSSSKPVSKKMTKAPQGNSSIENLQRQVLENQKILMNIQSQNSQKQSKRNTGFFTKHNHNNSISHMTSNLQGMAPLKSQMQTQNLRNQIGNKSILSSGQSNSGFSAISGKKKKSRKMVGPQSQNILNSQNASQILQSLAQNMQNIKSSSKQKRKQTSKARRGSISATGKFINFEQMQQQLEVGGVDLQKQEAPKGFQPHKNLMPKTTGSQAHLLNIQEAEKLTQKYNSLNQTGRELNKKK